MSQISSEYKYKSEKFIDELDGSLDLHHISQQKHNVVLVCSGLLEVYFLTSVLLHTDINIGVLITEDVEHFLIARVHRERGKELQMQRKQLIITDSVESIRNICFPGTKIIFSSQTIFKLYETSRFFNDLYKLDNPSMFYGRYILFRPTKNVYVRFQHETLSADTLIDICKKCQGYYRGVITKEKDWCISNSIVLKKIMCRVIYGRYACNVNNLHLQDLTEVFRYVKVKKEQGNFFSKKVKQFTVLYLTTGKEMEEWSPFCTVIAYN